MNTTLTNSFSWRRVWMLLRLYWPVMKWQVMLYPVITVISFFVGYLLMTIGVDITTSISFGNWIVGILFYLAPLILVYRDFTCVSTQLPTTAAEKLAMLVIYFFGVIGALTYGVYFLLSVICMPHMMHYPMVAAIMQIYEIMGHYPIIYVMSFLAAYTMQLFTLMGVLFTSKSRLGGGFAGLVIGYAIMVVLSAIIVVAITLVNLDSLKDMVEGAMDAIDPSAIDLEEPDITELMPIVKVMMPLIIKYMTALSVVGGTVFVTQIVITYKKLKCRGF